MRVKKIFNAITMRIAGLSLRGRVFFILSSVLLVIGMFGGILEISKKYSRELPVAGGTYHEGIIGIPRFINPVLAYSDADRDLTILVFSGLVRKGATGDMISDLAESFTISPDGKTYTFTLKSGLVFHDKKPLTSADILFTVERIQNPLVKSPLRVAWEGVTVTAPDTQTVIFKLEKPYAGFLQQAAVGILPAHIWTTIPLDTWTTTALNTEAIGSGAYQIQHITRDSAGIPESFTLKRFRQFALGKPFIKKIIIDTFANRSEASLALESGNLDGVTLFDQEDIDASFVKKFNVVESPLPRVFGLFLNPEKNPVFKDQSVVRALNLLIDRNAIIAQVFQGHGTELSGPFPIHESEDADLLVKQTLATNLLDKAGWKLNPETGLREKSATAPVTKNTKVKTTPVKQPGQPLAFTIVTANTPDLQATAEMVKDQYQAFGITVTIKVFEIGNLHETSIKGRDFEALLFGQVMKHDTDLFAFWHSSQKNAPGLNLTGYTNSRVDAWLQSAITESDPAKRFELYDKISAQLAIDAPVVFLYTPNALTVFTRRVHHPEFPSLALPSDRFSLIHEWYVYTDYVWNIFNNN